MSTETSDTGQSLQLNPPLGAPAANPGQFKKGQSGNPAGRPRGARNRATLMIAALLDEEGPRLMREAIDRALDGDSLLLRCCVTRMVPCRGAGRSSSTLPRAARRATFSPR
jgi:hypothetical protein